MKTATTAVAKKKKQLKRLREGHGVSEKNRDKTKTTPVQTSNQEMINMKKKKHCVRRESNNYNEQRAHNTHQSRYFVQTHTGSSPFITCKLQHKMEYQSKA